MLEQVLTFALIVMPVMKLAESDIFILNIPPFFIVDRDNKPNYTE